MIKNIIFDFGGVILDLDYKLTEEALNKVLETTINFQDLDVETKKVFDDYERGLENDEWFIWQLQNRAVKVPQAQEVIKAWNAMLIDIRQEKLDFLKMIKGHYNIFLLSNTNALHIRYVMRLLKEKYGIHDFDSYFTKSYYSHLVKMRKPDKDIFDYIVEDAQLNREECLFIDDLQSNVDGAQLAGIPARRFPANENLEVWFKKEGLL